MYFLIFSAIIFKKSKWDRVQLEDDEYFNERYLGASTQSDHTFPL